MSNYVQNFKVRNEYYRAAKRHLAVCKEIKKLLLPFYEFEKTHSELNTSEKILKSQLLADLYYLTGYVIECTYCMVIYHEFPKLNTKRDLIAVAGETGKKNISFSSKKKPNADTCIIADSNHKLSGFKNIFGQSYLNREIPIKENLFNNCQILFDEWEAEVRYAKTEQEPIKSNLTLDKVFIFLDGADKNFKACNGYHQ